MGGAGTIMVDEMRACSGVYYCHMAIDSADLESLHEFAARLGLRREWFKADSVPHYTLNRGQRQKAKKLGAQYVPYREMFTMAREAQKR